MISNDVNAALDHLVDLHDSLDDWQTPRWATRSLCDWLVHKQHERSICSFAGSLPPIEELWCARWQKYFAAVEPSDVHDYGVGFPVRDYLVGPLPELVDWTITNPPSALAEQFIARALATSRQGVAMIVETAFLGGKGRYERLFSVNPPSHILKIAEAIDKPKGMLCEDDPTAGGHVWLVWMGEMPTRFEWIAPCRKRMERASEYTAPNHP
jgi:hypothetical protein